MNRRSFFRMVFGALASTPLIPLLPAECAASTLPVIESFQLVAISEDLIRESAVDFSSFASVGLKRSDSFTIEGYWN